MRIASPWCALVLALASLCTGFARAADTATFATAADHYRKARWQQACDEFERLLAADPQFAGSSDAHFFYGESLVQLGRWKDSRPHFARVIELDPTGQRARQSQFRVGEAAYMVGDDTAAIKDLTDFHRRYPDDPLNAYALAYLGGLTLQAQQTEAASQWFGESLAQFPNGPMAAESQFGLAQARHQAGQLDEARAAYQQVVQHGGELAAPALLQVGTIQNLSDDYAAALATFDDFARRFPQNELADKAQLGRGYAELRLGRLEEARQTLAALTGKPETQGDATYYLALSEAAQGNWQAAAKTLQGIQLAPDHPLVPAVAFHTADALSHTGSTAEAREQFDRILQQYPNSAWADDSLLSKLRLAVESDDSAEGLRLADELIQRFPDSPLTAQAKLAKGQALTALGKPAEAIEALKSVLQVDTKVPDAADLHARAQGLLAVSQARLGQFEEAQRSLNELSETADAATIVNEAKLRVGELAQQAGQHPLAQNLLAGVSEGNSPASGRARSSLGWSHFEAGRWSEAAAAFQQVLETSTDESIAAEAMLLRGRALEHLKQSDDALATYQQVANEYPQSARAGEALLCAGRLNEQLGKTDDARRDYATLIEQYPDFAELDEALYRSAWLLRESNPEASAKLYDQLRTEFATSPYVADATLRVAEAAIKRHDFESATSLLREVTRPDAPPAVRPHALYLEGRMEMVRADWKAAQKPLTQLVNEHPDSELVLASEYLLAESYFRQGDYEQALEKLTAVSQKAAAHDEAWLPNAELRRAQSLAQLRRWDEASEIAQGIAARFPNFAEQYEADYLIGRAFAARADFDVARQWYAKVIQAPAAAESETAAMAQWMLGESYFHQEKYPLALAEYLRVGERFPRWHAAALLQAGKAQEAQGHWQMAAETYQKLIGLYPDGQLSEEAQRRLGAARQRASSEPPARK